MNQPKKYKGFEMFDEKEPGKPQNWCCTMTIVILVCSLNVCIIVGLRCMLEVKDKMGDPILKPNQRDLVVQLLAIMSMSFGFGCCGCFCCACRIPFYTTRVIRKAVKFVCFQCTEDGNESDDGEDSLVTNMYDQRNYIRKNDWHDAESGSSTGSPGLPLSPSSQALAPVAAAKARYESRKFLNGWGSSAVRPTSESVPSAKSTLRPLPIISTGVLEPMESLRHIEQQLYCPGLLTAETPMPRVLPKRRLTLATDTPLFDGKTFIF